MKSLLAGLILLTSTQLFAGEEKDLSFNGDFRFRHEIIKAEGSAERQRERVRARVGFKYKKSDQVRFHVQLATGSDDPVSTNQTLDGGFSTKTIGADLVYMTLTPTESSLEIIFGKQKMPFFKPGSSELIWDGDLRPEGLAIHWAPENYWIDLAGFSVDERSSAPDAFLIGTNIGLNQKMFDGEGHIKLGIGYYGYTHIKDQAFAYDPSDSFGNTDNTASGYKYEYTLAEGGLEVAYNKTKLYVDYVTNSGADKDNTGWLVGLSYGKVKAQGDISAHYNYRNIQKDAVLGAFTDSDFKGGGTDGKGHELSVSYGVMNDVKLAVSYFSNATSVDDSTNYGKTQIDLSTKF